MTSQLQKTLAGVGIASAIVFGSSAANAQRVDPTSPTTPAPSCQTQGTCGTGTVNNGGTGTGIGIGTGIGVGGAGGQGGVGQGGQGGVGQGGAGGNATGGNAQGGTANAASGASANNGISINTRMAIAPNLAVSNGWCMRSLSGSVGVYGFSGGLASGSFQEACGRWYTMAQGASNPTCPVGMFSVLVASGYKPEDALPRAVSTCFPSVAAAPPVPVTETATPPARQQTRRLRPNG